MPRFSLFLCATLCLVLLSAPAAAESPGSIHNKLLRALHEDLGTTTAPVDRATFEERLEFLGVELADRMHLDPEEAAIWSADALEAIDAAGLFETDARGREVLGDPKEGLGRMVDYMESTRSISPELARVFRVINAMPAGRSLHRFLVRDLPGMDWQGRDAEGVRGFVSVANHSFHYWLTGRDGSDPGDIVRASDKERFDAMCYEHIWNYGWANNWDPSQTFLTAYHGSAALSDAAY